VKANRHSHRFVPPEMRSTFDAIFGMSAVGSGVKLIHDFSQQEKGFGTMSAFIVASTRPSLIMEPTINNVQIPDVLGRPVGQIGNPPLTNSFGTQFQSAQLNETQNEVTHYGVLPLQKSINGIDGQLAYFTRYNNSQLTPDIVGDMLLNGVASEVRRWS